MGGFGFFNFSPTFFMTTLRPYQLQFVSEIRSSLSAHRHIIACSATGSGKTKTFLSIADTALSRGTTVLILTEARKIFRQIAEERKDSTEIKAGISHVWVEPGRLYVAMAQTLAKRSFIISQLRALGSRLLIICDEAHIGTPTKLLQQLREAYLIGFTATPDYKVAKHLPILYSDIVVGAQPQELVEAGFLSPYYHYERKSADLNDLKKDSKGEYTEESQFRIFDKPKIYAGLHQDLSVHKYRKAIIFCSSIKHCSTLAIELRAQNYVVAEVHTANPRADMELASFMHGPIDICVSVGILTKGFDFPEIDLVILQRATTSLALYCQMIGRGSRIAPHKTKFTVLDYGGNASRHGLWNYEHDWASKWKPSKKKKKENQGVAPVRECPRCFLLISPRTPICPECGYEFATGNTELAEGTMVSVTAEYDKIRGRKISTLTPAELVTYRNVTNKKSFAIRVAKARGEEYLREFARLMNFSPYFVNMQDFSKPISFHDIIIR